MRGKVNRLLPFVLSASMLAAPACADLTWTGTTSTDWMNANNWNPAGPIAGANCVVNTTPANKATTTVTAFTGADLKVATNGTLQLNANCTVNGTLTADGGTILSGNNYTLTSGLIINSGGCTVNENNGVTTTILTGPISGTGPLSKIGNGTLQCNSAPSGYSGAVTISAGILSMGGYGTMTSGRVTVANGAVLLITGQNGVSSTETLGSLGGEGTVNLGTASGATVTLASGSDNTDSVFTGKILNVATAQGRIGALRKVGTGTLTLTNTASAYSGGTVINGGVLVAGGTIGAGAVNSPFGTGAVTLNGGDLRIASGCSFDRAFTFTTGTVSGDGTFTPSVTVASGSTLSPGSAGAGTLTFGNNLTLQSGCTNQFDLGPTNASDRVVVTGALSLGGTFTFTKRAGIQSGTYELMSFGSITTNSAPVLIVPRNCEISLSTDGVNKKLLLDIRLTGSIFTIH